MNNNSLLTSTKDTRIPSLLPSLLPPRERTVFYTGTVTESQNEQVLKSIGTLLDTSIDPIGLLVTSPGGTTGSAMSFYDAIKHILKPDLVTIGSGDVDSSGIIIFLTGNRRYVSPRTTMLLHSAGRHFGSQRYTTKEMKAMLQEDRLKDSQYAGVVAQNSHGRLTVPQVLMMMERETVLSPADMIKFGLADFMLS